jgi:hypothetical protein
MDKQTNIKKQIEQTENKLSKLKVELENCSVKDNLLDVPEIELEIEITVTNKGLSYNDIMALKEVQEKIKKGWRLLSLCREEDYVNEVSFLEKNPTYSKILKMDGSSTKDDFFVSQMFRRNAEQGLVAGFYADSGYSGLYSGRDPGYAVSVRGVRFCRKKNFKKEINKK